MNCINALLFGVCIYIYKYIFTSMTVKWVTLNNNPEVLVSI